MIQSYTANYDVGCMKHTDGTMTKENYIKIIDEAVLPSIEKMFPVTIGSIFQDL